MYAKTKSYGGVKGRPPQAGTYKRSSAAKAKLNTARANMRAQQTAAGFRAAKMYKTLGVIENKFYDPFTANGLKQLDTSNSGTLANSAGGYLLTTAATPAALVINQIPQGTTQNSRLARRALITGIRLKGFVQAAAAGTISQVALNVVHQVPPNNPTQMPAFTDLWVAQSVNSLRNVDNADKLKIVRRWDWNICGNAVTPQTGQELAAFDEYIDLSKSGGILTEWTQADTTGVYGNMEKGALMLYAQGNANVTPPQIFLSVRLYFSDQ